jgi:linoleoyl-CoA desaturase
LEIGRYLKGRIEKKDFRNRVTKVLKKIGRQATRDYALHPLLSGPSAPTTLTANLTANLVRNLWTHSVIMCGHFPEGVQTYEKTSIDGETRGQWYLRQMLGSANISGSPAMHFMTGNLSFQIEHHLYPDLPSNRYQEIAPKVQEVFERYGLTYTTGPLPKQVASAWKKIIRLSLPNDFWPNNFRADDFFATLMSGPGVHLPDEDLRRSDSGETLAAPAGDPRGVALV